MHVSAGGGPASQYKGMKYIRMELENWRPVRSLRLERSRVTLYLHHFLDELRIIVSTLNPSSIPELALSNTLMSSDHPVSSRGFRVPQRHRGSWGFRACRR